MKRVAIIGCGALGTTLMRIVKERLSDRYTLCGVMAAHMEHAQEAAARWGCHACGSVQTGIPAGQIAEQRHTIVNHKREQIRTASVVVVIVAATFHRVSHLILPVRHLLCSLLVSHRQPCCDRRETACFSYKVTKNISFIGRKPSDSAVAGEQKAGQGGTRRPAIPDTLKTEKRFPLT